MGFRAKYLLSTADRVATREFELEKLRQLPLPTARTELTTLPGVGEKIADCVLLFAYGFPNAFPIDVWVARALSQFYFKGRRKRPDQLRQFAARHFGPNAGYAQQYLFHHIRTQMG
jgi:N-glycosylase/DNA lyase